MPAIYPSSSGVAYGVYGAYSTRPTAGTSGRRFMPTDGPVQFLDTGSTWVPEINGARGTQVPAASTFTKIGTSPGSGIADSAGTLLLTPSTTAGVGECWYYTTSLSGGTPTFQLDVAFSNTWGYSGVGGQEALFAICVHDTASGKINRYGIYCQNTDLTLQVQRFTNVTTSDAVAYSSTATAWLSAGGFIWLRIVQDATYTSYSFSNDGVNYRGAYRESANAFLVPNKVALWVSGNGGGSAEEIGKAVVGSFNLVTP